MANSDVWVVHGSMLNSHRKSGLGDDRADLVDLGLDEAARRGVVVEAAVRWWGGSWPELPTRVDRLTVAALAAYRFEETPRSVADDLPHKEFVLYPPTMTLEEAVSQISSQRVRD